MTSYRIRHLPVIEDARLCGIVSIGDVVKARLDEIEAEAEALRTYVATA
jgi:CBS domain-containing protein